MAANKVLIVDKNSEMRTKIREMLPSGNFQVLEAIDGEEAMSMLDLQRKGLRLVIFNFQLPAVSGWEILKKVQTDGNLQKVATIILGDRVDDIQAVVPPPYFEYIEVLETTCDRKTLHKAMKSAVGKTKVARQPLPTEPLVAPLSVDEVPTPPPPTEETPDLLDLDLESLTIEATESEESLAPEPEVKLEEELPAFSTELPVESTKKIDSQNPFSSAELEDVGENSLDLTESSTNSHADPFSSAELEDAGENSLDSAESSTNSHANPFSSAELEDTREISLDSLELSTNSQNLGSEPIEELGVEARAPEVENRGFQEIAPDFAEIPVNSTAPSPSQLQESQTEFIENGESVAVDTAEYAIAPTPYEALDCYHIISDRAAWGIDCLAISPDGQYLIGGSESNPIKIWNLATGTIETQWNLYSKGTSCLTLTSDGQVVIAGALETNLKLWDFHRGELLGPLNDHASGINAIAIAPDGITLVSGALRSNIKLWDLQSGNLIGPLNDQSFGTTALAITPDGQTLITGCDPSNIKLWDLSAGELLGPLNIESSRVTSLILSPDGQLVISGHSDGVIAIADLYSGEVLRRLKAHQKPVNAMVMTPDGQVIISVSDTEIKFWGAVSSNQ